VEIKACCSTVAAVYQGVNESESSVFPLQTAATVEPYGSSAVIFRFGTWPTGMRVSSFIA